MDVAPSDPLVGRLMDGRYRVERLIARGGMASVYVAADTRLERRVALKVMHPHLADDAEAAARFEREARSAARLSHPDVVAVYDQGADGGHTFLVMEYVAGANLREVLRASGPLPIGQALAVMDHVLAALATAHEAGLVHRDMKPENVLVTADGRVKVADFGLARAMAGTNVTATGALLMGTAAYLAPETVSRGVVDARSDVYAAGIMLFELLTGEPPFPADNAFAVLQRHVHEDVPPPSRLRREVPAEVDALVGLATERDPQHRAADAGVLHDALIDTRDQLGLHAGVPSLPANVTTRLPVVPAADPGRLAATRTVAEADARGTRRRSRWPVLLAALLVTVALAVAAGWWLAVGRYTHPPRVTGLSRAAAEARLEAAGLHPKLLPGVHSVTVPANLVAVESPGPGDRVSHHGTVGIRLSLGPLHHDLPSLADQSVGQAKQALLALHFRIGKTRHAYSDTVAKGLVVDTDPPHGTNLGEGQPVSLVVSKGAAPVPVPRLRGLSIDDATSALTKVGLAVGSTRQAFDNRVPDGDVISSTPAAGTTIKRGRSVSLVLSKGPHLYPVPDVDGKSINDAVRIITQAGFVADARQAFPGGPGTVFRESPGGSQRKGTRIELDYF